MNIEKLQRLTQLRASEIKNELKDLKNEVERLASIHTVRLAILGLGKHEIAYINNISFVMGCDVNFPNYEQGLLFHHKNENKISVKEGASSRFNVNRSRSSIC